MTTHADNIKRLAEDYAVADWHAEDIPPVVEKRLHAAIDALQAERDAQAAEIARLREALKTISRTEYHITRPPIFSLDEQMRQIARKALEQTK